MQFGKPWMHRHFVSVDVEIDSAAPVPGTDWLTLRFESHTSVVVTTGHMVSGLGGCTQQDALRGIVVLDGVVKGLVRFTIPEGTRQVILADRTRPVAEVLLERDHNGYTCPVQHSLTAMQQMAKAADAYMWVNPGILDVARVVFLQEMRRQAEDARVNAASTLDSAVKFRDQVQSDLEAARKKVGRNNLNAMSRAGGSC